MKYLLNQETERLTFRRLEKADFDAWKILFLEDEIKKMLGMQEFKTAEECFKWFEIKRKACFSRSII